MKTKIIILTAFLLIAAVSVGAYNFWQDKPVAKISFPLGNVLVLKKGEKKMQKASFNQNLYTGDKVRTEKQARCEIKYNDGSIIRIDQQSIYTIEKVQEGKDR